MKQINVTIEDELHKELINKKSGLTWIEFLKLLLTIPDKKIEELVK